MKRLWLLVTMLGGLLPAVSGCGDQTTQKVYKTSGTLVFEDDGKPAANAPLSFAPATVAEGQRSPFAITDENGKFELSTYGDKDGAPAGDYTVYIDPISASRGVGAGKPPALPPMGGPPGTAMAAAASPYAKEYLAAASSPLKVTIKSGGGDLGELKIKRGPGAPKP